MNPMTSENHDLIRSSVRDFAEREIKPIISELDKTESFSIELTKKMGDLGLFGMTIPEIYGGKGMDYLSLIIAVEELARVDGSQAATLAAHETLGVWPIYTYGTEKQKLDLLPDLVNGSGLWAFGLTEPDAGSDARNTRTKAVESNEGWTINGSKIFITNGSTEITKGVTVLSVVEGTEKKSYTCFLVKKDTKGFAAKTMHNKLVWRASNTSELFFTDCTVTKSDILGKIGEGSKIMLSSLDVGKLAIAAMGLGLAQGAYEMALKYAKDRKQFGQPIAQFQAIAFKLADMAVKLETARNTLYKACWLKDHNQEFAFESTISKLYCSEVAQQIANEAVQIFGGYGLMHDYQIERFYRDQRLLQIGEGTSEIQRLIISRKIGCYL